MGVLNWKKELYHSNTITTALKRRGLRPDLSEPWEVHGPHAGMNFQMYVGYASNTDDPKDIYCVTVWPGRGVWEIDDPSQWNQTDPERRITI